MSIFRQPVVYILAALAFGAASRAAASTVLRDGMRIGATVAALATIVAVIAMIRQDLREAPPVEPPED